MTATTSPTIRVAPHTRRSVDAATVTTITATGFVVVLAALHVLKSDLSPTWRMVSEYEIGRHGWLMQTAFLLLAASCIATRSVLRPLTSNKAGRIGRGALIVTAVGLALAAIATADPTTATRDQLTTHGTLHGIGAMLGIPGFLVAAICISRSVRDNPTYARPICNATRFVVAAAAVFAVSMATMFHGTPSTPDTRIGIQNRVLVVAQAVWLLTVANRARRARRARRANRF